MEDIVQIKYALDTFYFLICGALVMWMAAGFAMLEAGLVRAKNTTEILTKNVALFAIACTMYLLVGYHIMYSSPEGGIFPSFGVLIGAENTVEDVLAGGDDAPYYSVASDFFFQVVFVATAMSIVSGAVAERMKLFAFGLRRDHDWLHLPDPGLLEMGRWLPERSWLPGLRRFRCGAHDRCYRCSGWCPAAGRS